jgi:hypothetical protein
MICGDERQKQFCSIFGEKSVRSTCGNASIHSFGAIVAFASERALIKTFYCHEFADTDRSCIIMRPLNCWIGMPIAIGHALGLRVGTIRFSQPSAGELPPFDSAES